jgi:phage-related minor tail protein
MNTTPRSDRYSNEALNRLHDEAHERAPQLRQDAMKAFWDGIVDLVSAQWLSARLAAERSVKSRERHERLRAAGRAQEPTQSC